jgi:hypothetical protein
MAALDDRPHAGMEPAITMEAKACLTAVRVGKRRSLILTNCEQPGFSPAMRAPAKGLVPAARLGRERNRYASNPQFLYRIRFINHLTSG